MLPEVNNTGTVALEDEFLPLKMKGLTAEMVRKAEKELNETPERRQEALKELKDLIKAEENLQALMDDKFLLRFLRARKFDPKRAMATLINFYTYKARYSGKITDKLPSEIEKFFSLNAASTLPRRNRDGSALFFMKAAHLDLNKVTFDDILAAVFILSEIMLQSEANQICGMVFIVDHQNLSFRLTTQLASPTGLYRLMKGVQDCIPGRIKAIHVVNEPFYYSVIYNVIKPFLSAKIKSRYLLHGRNLENLYKNIPPEILPQEIGGGQGPLDCKEINNEVATADSYFSKLFKYGFKGKRAENCRRMRSIF